MVVFRNCVTAYNNNKNFCTPSYFISQLPLVTSLKGIHWTFYSFQILKMINEIAVVLMGISWRYLRMFNEIHASVSFSTACLVIDFQFYVGTLLGSWDWKAARTKALCASCLWVRIIFGKSGNLLYSTS